MIEPRPWTECSSSLLKSLEGMDLENRLGLYQLFLKIYEHHPNLLNDLLQLENLASQSPTCSVPAYVQAGVQDGQPYLITNLLDGKTQRLSQPQGIWIIGRDRYVNLPIQEPWLSRRHAAIQYVPNEGFYLVDLKSTNGSFLNGEPVWQRILLKDGDQIRLGSLSITFFICETARKLELAPPEVLDRLQAAALATSEATITETSVPALQPATLATSEAAIAETPESAAEGDQPPVHDPSKETSQYPKLNRATEMSSSGSSLSHLNVSPQSEILDRFFSRQIPVEQN